MNYLVTHFASKIDSHSHDGSHGRVHSLGVAPAGENCNTLALVSAPIDVRFLVLTIHLEFGSVDLHNKWREFSIVLNRNENFMIFVTHSSLRFQENVMFY